MENTPNEGALLTPCCRFVLVISGPLHNCYHLALGPSFQHRCRTPTLRPHPPARNRPRVPADRFRRACDRLRASACPHSLARICAPVSACSHPPPRARPVRIFTILHRFLGPKMTSELAPVSGPQRGPRAVLNTCGARIWAQIHNHFQAPELTPACRENWNHRIRKSWPRAPSRESFRDRTSELFCESQISHRPSCASDKPNTSAHWHRPGRSSGGTAGRTRPAAGGDCNDRTKRHSEQPIRDLCLYPVQNPQASNLLHIAEPF